MKLKYSLFLIFVLILSTFISAAPTSFYSNEFELNPGTITLTGTPLLIANFTIANPLEGNRVIMGSGSVRRITGTGTQTLYSSLNQNSIEVYNSTLQSFSTSGVWGAFSSVVNNFSAPIGVNEYEIYLEDTSNTYEFSEYNSFSIADVTYNLNPLAQELVPLTISLPNTLGAFTQVGTYIYDSQSNGELSLIIDLKTSTTRNNGDYQRYYIYHVESDTSTLIFESNLPNSAVVRSTGTNKIFNVNSGTNTFRLFASTGLSTGSTSGTLGFAELTSSIGNTIQSQYNNCGGTSSIPITLDPGWTKLCDIDYNLLDGNSTILFWDADFEKSAVGTLEIKVNGTNITEESTLYRSTQEPNEFIHIPIRDIIPFNNSDSATIEIWVNVPDAGTTTIQSAPITLLDTTLGAITSSATPPVANNILIPLNGSYLYNDTLLDTIKVTPFSDAQGPVYYNVNVTSINGSDIGYNISVVSGYYLTTFSLDYQSLPANNTYEILIEGCNIYAQCTNTTSIFYLDEAPFRTSFIGRDLDTEIGTWDSSTGETLLANGTFKALNGSSGFTFGSGSVKKECPDSKSQSIEGTLGINDGEYFLGTLRTFKSCNVWGSYSLNGVHIENLSLDNTFSFEFTDENGTFTFNENEFLMIANYTKENQSIMHDVVDLDIAVPVSFAIDSYTNIFNFTAFADDHSLALISDFKVSSEIQTASSFYIINYNTSEVSRTSYTQTGGNYSTFSTGNNWVFENLPLGENKFGILVSSTDDDLTINGTIITLNFIDSEGNGINYGTNKYTCVIPQSGIVIAPGWTQLCTADLLNNLNNSNLVFLDLDAFSSNNVTAVIQINSTASSQVDTYYRTFDDNSRYGHIPIRMFNPSSAGVITYEAWIYVDKPITVYPGAILITNIKNEEGEVDYYAPMPGKVTLPEDGSVFAEDLGATTVEWKAFLGVRPSTYDVDVYLKDGGLIMNIAEDVTGTSTTFNYGRLIYGQEYTMVVSGCNPSGQCRSATADFTFERSYEAVKNECQGMLGNIYESFDLLTLAIMILAAGLVIGAVLALAGGRSGGLDFNATIIIIVITSCLIATAMWLMNYLGAAHC